MVMASAGVNNMPEGPIDSDECRLGRRRRLAPRRYVHTATASSSAPAPPPAEEGPSSSASSEGSQLERPEGEGEGEGSQLERPEGEGEGEGEGSQLERPEGEGEGEGSQLERPEGEGEGEGEGSQLERPEGEGEGEGSQEEEAPPSSSSEADTVVAAAPQVPSTAKAMSSWWPVAFGSVALAGRLREMEDTVSLHPSLCAWADGSPMHFFAVFDGHGGPHAAALCREQMHTILAEELAGAAAAFSNPQPASSELAFSNPQPASSELAGAAAAFSNPQPASSELAFSNPQPASSELAFSNPQPASSEPSSSSSEQQRQESEQRAWRGALSRSFARADELAGWACACGRATLPSCSCPLSSAQKGAIVGSTAVVALLVRDRLVVANCGDSRAVLSRGGVAVPLSEDQKPDRPDEMARIKAAGGKVMFINGARVRGILAMSRALGHRLLKPEVICEPEITITERSEDDDCLILASDGLWDVISNKVACDVARQCLEDGSPTRAPAAGSSEAAPSSSGGAAPVVSQEEEPRCFRAAALLARLALGRESSDNISVVVIDLKVRG